MKRMDAERMATSLMKYYGVSDYHFKFMRYDDRWRVAGQVNYSRKTLRLAPLFVELNNPMVVKNTILHEIAHCLEPKAQHGQRFQTTAGNIGHRITNGNNHTYYGYEVKHRKSEAL